MTTDDNQKPRQLLDMTAALISSMDVARRGHTEPDRTAWFSYKVFATRYMAIIHQLPQDFPALVVLNPYNTSDMPEPSRSRPSYQRLIFEGVYTDLWILRSSLESIIGTAGDERRALTDFFQSRLRAAMMDRPEDEKAVQDTVEALLVGRGLQKGQEYDRETGRVKLSSKESIPDFILPPFEEAIEVKLVKDRRRVSEVIDEINADIPAYLSKYRHLLFIVYNLGQIQDEADFPVPPRLKKYIDATRIVAGASVPTSAACIGATFNLLAVEDIDVQSRANVPHPSGLYFVVGSESGWRKSASFRETMQGHVEADERVEALHHEADSNTEEGMEFRVKGFSPRALRQDFTIEALLSRLWKARRTMAVANSDASSLLGGWSFRNDNLSRSLSHFVSLWDGDPTSIDRRNPDTPEIFFYQRRLTAMIMGQVNVVEDLLFSQAAGNGFTARCLPSMDRERPKPPADTSTSFQAALDTIADMRELVIRRRADQDANVELLRGVQRRPVIHPEHDARDLLAAASAKFDALADATDNLHERGFWARAQEQMARYAATLAYVRTLEDGIPQSWENVHYTRPEVEQAEAVITWHGELIRSYAVQAASEKVTRLANETITMLREKREKVVKEDGSIAARNVIARLGKGELRTDAALREQVLDVLVVHRHLIPTARRGHYMMVVPHD